MAIEYRGSDFLYLVHIPDDDENFRLFNQTSGSSESEADEIELDTKDKSGSDYGKVAHRIEIEGILSQGDKAVTYITKAQRRKEFVKIIEVNTRTQETEEGMYMLNTVSKEYDNGEFATYSISAALNSSLTEGELKEIPDGAGDVDEGDVGGGDNDEDGEQTP